MADLVDLGVAQYEFDCQLGFSPSHDTRQLLRFQLGERAARRALWKRREFLELGEKAARERIDEILAACQ